MRIVVICRYGHFLKESFYSFQEPLHLLLKKTTVAN